MRWRAAVISGSGNQLDYIASHNERKENAPRAAAISHA